MLSRAVSCNTLVWRRHNCFQKQQLRHLKLLHELFVSPPFPIDAKNQAQLNACRAKRLPNPVDIELNLDHGPNVQSERLSLSETQARLKPLCHLNLSTHGVTRDLSWPPPSLDEEHHLLSGKDIYLAKDKTYYIAPLTLQKDFIPLVLPDKFSKQGKRKPKGGQVKFGKFIHAGRGRQVHFTIYTTPPHLHSLLRMAYENLLQGCRIEFHLHQKSKDERVENTVNWALKHCLHLRPDVILRAMPEGTELLGLPATSKDHMGEELVWAFELPETLAEVGQRTPDHIKKRAMWGRRETTAMYGRTQTTNEAPDGE